jgi:zinc/manganese transport system substrate-binding protein
MHPLVITPVALALFVALAGPAPAAGPVGIVAAENFYGDLAAQIGGSHVQVTSILANPDDDPHLFESTPSTARLLADAQVVIYNGADYDPWMDRLLSTAATGDRVVIVAADLTGHHGGDNPHLWYEPTTFPIVAAALAAELEKRDPADAADYKANLDKFNAAFAAITAGIGTVRARYAGTTITATEPVFGYMASAMGLKMLNVPFQVAIMNQTEPSPSDVVAFENSLRDRTAKILIYNSQVTDDATGRLIDLAEAGNIPVIGVTELEPAGQSVETWFSSQIAAVQSALASQP